MKINKKTKVGVAIAGVAGIALVTGGGFALWSDTANVNGGVIQSGNLDIESVGSTTAVDTTPNRADVGHTIDLATWKAVPGDTVQLENSFDVALQGDNLLAKVNTGNIDAAIPADAQEYVTYEVSVVDGEGNVVAPNADGDYLFQAPRDGQAAGQAVDGVAVAGATIDGTTDFKTVVTVSFSADTPTQVLSESNLTTVNNAAVTLEQVIV